MQCSYTMCNWRFMFFPPFNRCKFIFIVFCVVTVTVLMYWVSHTLIHWCAFLFQWDRTYTSFIFLFKMLVLHVTFWMLKFTRYDITAILHLWTLFDHMACSFWAIIFNLLFIAVEIWWLRATGVWWNLNGV